MSFVINLDMLSDSIVEVTIPILMNEDFEFRVVNPGIDDERVSAAGREVLKVLNIVPGIHGLCFKRHRLILSVEQGFDRLEVAQQVVQAISETFGLKD